jgi:hypothetical protein
VIVGYRRTTQIAGISVCPVISSRTDAHLLVIELQEDRKDIFSKMVKLQCIFEQISPISDLSAVSIPSLRI